MAKVRGMGATLYYLPTYDSVLDPTEVGSLTSIGEITPESEELDATALDSAGGYKEYLQGFKDSGELALSGFHDGDDTGQAKCRSEYAAGTSGYWWVLFPDRTLVGFTAYIKSYTAGPAEVDGIVGFGATLRVISAIYTIYAKAAVAQSKAAGQTATMDSTATVTPTIAPAYQWYSNNSNDYDTPTLIGGETNATYTTGALGAGVYYYFCKITVALHRYVYSQIHVITVT